jgi:hypothetical protein
MIINQAIVDGINFYKGFYDLISLFKITNSGII